MRIGLYGLPAAGKTTLMKQVDFLPTLSGSGLLRELDPSFPSRAHGEQDALRKRLARSLLSRERFLMDGHYAFGETVVFTEEDGQLYDAFLYLYTSPGILKRRMEESGKNRRYLAYDLEAWQQMEIQGLRSYCHRNNKDFYVLDNPPENSFGDLADPLSFLRAVLDGFSCVGFSRTCAASILANDSRPEILLTDGDRTLTLEDSSSAVFHYRTHLFDGNFYTGYQSWRQARDFQHMTLDGDPLPVRFSQPVLSRLHQRPYILTSGHPGIWARLSESLGFPCFSGAEMSADAKFFITKFLQEAGRTVTAYGDSMNDYYMLRQADDGYLVTRPDGSVSRSLKDVESGGISHV